MGKKEFISVKGRDDVTGIKVTSKSYVVDFSESEVFVKVFYDDETKASISQSIKVEKGKTKTSFVFILTTKQDFKKVVIEVSSNVVDTNLLVAHLEPQKFEIPQ